MRRFRPAASTVALALVLLGGTGPVRAASPAEPPRDLLLEVYLNGIDTEQVGSFRADGVKLLATVEELVALGLAPPAGTRPGAMLDVRRLPGVRADVDERAQAVRMVVPVAGLASHRLDPLSAAAGPAPSNASLGALVNYDVTATTRHASVDLFGLTSARLFGAFGTAPADFTLTRSASGLRAVRLGTTYSYSDPDRIRTFSAGDVITGALAYSRAIRLGGMQLSTNFALRPDLVTYPLPTISGGAAVPSTVDVLVNGVRQLSTPVAAGPFYVPQLPVVSGAGQVSVAVRDAAGQQTIQTSSFYASAALLRPGLSSFSMELGAVRRDYGVNSGSYGPPAISLTGRRGLTPWLTVEGHAEAAAHLGLASGGAVVELGDLAVATAGVGLSGSRVGTGAQTYLAIERQASLYHLGLSLLASSARFRDIGALAGDPTPRHIFQASAGLVFGSQGSLGIAYTDVDQRGVRSVAATSDLPSIRDAGLRPAIRTSLLSATYSRELFGRAYSYLTGYRDLRGGGAVMAGVSLRFGRHGSINTSYETASHQATVEASRPALDPGDFGWRIYGAQGGTDRLLAEGRYRGTHADLGIGVDSYGGTSYVQANARGSLIAINGGVYAANTINDGFALVDTQGLGGIAVTLNNRPVGRTDASGRLLVPGLVAFQPNKLAINPSDLPLDTHWERLDVAVAPGDRSGMVARFGLKRQHAVLLAVRLAGGDALPVGSQVVLGDSGTAVESGFDGQVFFPDLAGHHRFVATMPDGSRCGAEFDADAPSAGGTVEAGCTREDRAPRIASNK